MRKVFCLIGLLVLGCTANAEPGTLDSTADCVSASELDECVASQTECVVGFRECVASQTECADGYRFATDRLGECVATLTASNERLGECINTVTAANNTARACLRGRR